MQLAADLQGLDRPTRVLGSILLSAALLAVIPADGTAQTRSAPTGARAVLDSILRTPPSSRAHWGVAVYDLATGESVLVHNEHRLFSAASTMKLVTAAAALDLLGPEFRFETVLEATVDREGRAHEVVVRGSGDPTLGSPFHGDPLAPLDSLADSLVAAGLRAVDGPLVIDQSRFDSTLVHPAWEVFDLDWYYAAPVAAFAVMGGAVEIIVTPGAPGSAAGVELPHGAGLVGLDARITTVPGDGGWDDVLRRPPDADSLILRGSVGVGRGPDTSWVAQARPGHTAGLALWRALERAGIPVEGPVIVRYGAGEAGAEPARGSEAGNAGLEPTGSESDPGIAGGAIGHRVVRITWRSPPLAAILRVAVERSDNWVTEQVLKTLAATRHERGDWSGGTDLVEEYMVERVGVPRDAIFMRDGSGLTPQGLLTPNAVVGLLRYVETRPWREAFMDALAAPGEPESTLDDRLLSYRDRIAAKTGTLRHVNALSGYLAGRDGRDLVFSILSNGSGQPSWKVKAAIDRIVRSLIENGS